MKKLDGSKAKVTGFKKDNWKKFKLDDGTPVLVPELFNTEKNSDGSIYQYPQGDKNAKPSCVMPKNGYYFNAIIKHIGLFNYSLHNRAISSWMSLHYLNLI